MQVYTRESSHYFCGHCNGSPLEIGDSTLLRSASSTTSPSKEAQLEVERDTVLLKAGSVVMVHPGECRRISWVHPELGARWIVVKQESHPNGKHIVSARVAAS